MIIKQRPILSDRSLLQGQFRTSISFSSSEVYCRLNDVIDDPVKSGETLQIYL